MLEKEASSSEIKDAASGEKATSEPTSRLNSLNDKSHLDTVKDTSKTMKDTSKRMSISLTGHAADVLDQLARDQSITQNEALRKAIGTESYIREEVSKGSQLIIRRTNGEQVEVIFR